MDFSKINKTSIIGFVRYSCWESSFGKKYSDFFSSEYLDYRLDIFRNITLKSFQEQSDKDFNVFLLHSENLPLKYKDIFKNLEDNNNFLHNMYISDSENMYNVLLSRSIEYVKFTEGGGGGCIYKFSDR